MIPTVKDIEQAVKQPDKLLTIKENVIVTEAAKKMSDNKVGCLIVLDTQDKLAGVLSERDMLVKVSAMSLSADNVFVRDIMTTEVISCSIDTAISKVEHLMAKHKIRHVPIVKDGVPLGMVSSRDIMAYRLRSNKAMKAAAEQLAMLSTGLKSLHFDDVIALAIDEVPKIFEAGWATLRFDQKNSPTPMIYQKSCSLFEENLPTLKQIKKLSPDGQVIYDNVRSECEKLGAKASRLVIPLSICEQPGKRGDSIVSREGFLCMCQFNPSSIDTEQLRLYKASLLREILNANLTNAYLHQNYQKARRDSEIDSLTGVGTRRMLERKLMDEHTRSIRYKHPFSIAIVDIDNFKQVNDNAGHATGDMALKQLAKVMHNSVRTVDVVARYGGDEFALLMPETKLTDAAELLERIRCRVESISIPNVPSITISCGVAEWTGAPGDSAQSILERADAALYEAKRSGRNCVVADETAHNWAIQDLNL